MSIGRPAAAATGFGSRVLDKCFELFLWALENPRKVIAGLTVLIVGLGIWAMIAHPPEAAALELKDILLPVIPGVGIASWAADTAVSGITDILKSCIVGLLSWCTALVSNTANGTMLTSTFQELLGNPEIYNRLHDLHQTAVIPLGNVVAAAFLVFGLMRIVSRAGQTDGGIDTWQLIFLFVMYGAAKMCIDGSWEIMYSLFQVSNAVIHKLLTTADMSALISDPTEGIENAGVLLAMLVVTFFVLIVSLIVCGLSHAVVIVRAIQIYIYTVFSPVPIAFAVSEEGREMTKTFFKRYAALLLSGAMLVLLFYIFSMAMSVAPMPEGIVVTDIGSFIGWATLLLLNYLVFYGAFGYAIFKSGAWTRDLIGI